MHISNNHSPMNTDPKVSSVAHRFKQREARSIEAKAMKSQILLGIAVVVAVAALVVPGGAQDASCLKQLVPCLNYLNGTRDPPSSCCDPLKSVIKSDPKCLCSLISNKAASKAERADVDVSKAQELPGRCGQHVNPIACLASSPDSNDSVQNSANFNGVGAVMALLLGVLLI